MGFTVFKWNCGLVTTRAKCLENTKSRNTGSIQRKCINPKCTNLPKRKSVPSVSVYSDRTASKKLRKNRLFADFAPPNRPPIAPNAWHAPRHNRSPDAPNLWRNPPPKRALPEACRILPEGHGHAPPFFQGHRAREPLLEFRNFLQNLMK